VPVPYARLSAMYFAYFAFIGAFAPYFSLYLVSIGASAWDIAVLISLMQVTRVFAPNFWAWFADHHGAKHALLRASLALAALAFCGTFATRSFWGLLAVLAALSFFSSAANPLLEATTFGHLRGRLERYGTIRLWGSVGFIAAVLAVGAALDRLGIAHLLWMLLAILAAAAALAWLLPAVGGERPAGREDPERPPPAVGTARRPAPLGPARALAARARLLPRELDRRGDPAQGLLELDLDRVVDVLAAPLGLRGGRATGLEGPVAEPVVDRPGAGVGQDPVRLGDLREDLARALVPDIDVRRALPGQSPVRLADRLDRGVAGRPEDVIVVPLPHAGAPGMPGAPPQCFPPRSSNSASTTSPSAVFVLPSVGPGPVPVPGCCLAWASR